jgi:hypothetical protein
MILVAGCMTREPAPPLQYELSGHRQDGAPVTITVRPGRWAEVVHLAPGADERLVVGGARVVRYGIYGDVNVADPVTAAEHEMRRRLLTGALGSPLPVSTANRAVYVDRGLAQVQVSRKGDQIISADVQGLGTYREFGATDGVITKWRSLEGDGFEGERSAESISGNVFASPAALPFQGGDPSVALIGDRSIKVFIDTGTSGFAVSSQVARDAQQLGVAVPVQSANGLVREALVHLSSFRQLGVTRRDQIARTTSAIPSGYDAVEGIGMLNGLALHFEADRRVRADRRGCTTGLRYRSWDGVALATINVEGSFGGRTTFDSGHVGMPFQRVSPIAMVLLESKRGLDPHPVTGSVRPYTALCTQRPVVFSMEHLGTVRHPMCYVPDFSGISPDISNVSRPALFVEPVSFLGAATTIDTARNLICRDL